MQKNVIIVAGGSGTRMGRNIPKQFIELNGKPILMHSILAFYNYDNSINIIVALPKDQISFWEKLCIQYSFSNNHKVVEGGQTRFHSVKNALSFITNGLVAIHDGVRPLVSQKTIENAFSLAKEKGNAIPTIGITESIRIEHNGINKVIDRDSVKIIQTPQIFTFELIRNAYKQEFSKKFTDDASVLESIGEAIHLSSGNQENIKITTSFDLIIAEAIIKNFEN